jgi:hypothetical protein
VFDAQEFKWLDRWKTHRYIKLAKEGIKGIRPDHFDTGLATKPSVGAGQQENGMNRSPIAQGVVCPEVTGIRGHLIQVGLGGALLALRLDNDDAAAHEQQGVWAAMVQWELILQDRPVGWRATVAIEHLSNFALKGRDRLIPGAELLGGCIGEER